MEARKAVAPGGRLAASLAVALALLAALVAGCRDTQPSCPECGRLECTNLAFTIRLQDGRGVSTCCPRCGLHYLASCGVPAAALSVRDFDTARGLDARRAFYVEGSDVSPCAAMEGSPPKDERGCCLTPVYDRCQPSLIAFAARGRAEAFAREHGGIIRTFGEVAGGMVPPGAEAPAGS